MSTIPELEGSNRFLVQQVFKPIANEYRISIPTPGSTDEGRPVLFVKQKKLKIREDIRFRTSQDDDRAARLHDQGANGVRVPRPPRRARRRRQPDRAAREGVRHARCSAATGASRTRTGTELFEAHESSWPIAIVRRFADLGPDWLSLLSWLPFNFVLKRDGEQVGTYKRVLGKLRDRYVLELEPEFDADRRLVIAFAVALDALQDR